MVPLLIGSHSVLSASVPCRAHRYGQAGRLGFLGESRACFSSCQYEAEDVGQIPAPHPGSLPRSEAQLAQGGRAICQALCAPCCKGLTSELVQAVKRAGKAARADGFDPSEDSCRAFREQSRYAQLLNLELQLLVGL